MNDNKQWLWLGAVLLLGLVLSVFLFSEKRFGSGTSTQTVGGNLLVNGTLTATGAITSGSQTMSSSTIGTLSVTSTASVTGLTTLAAGFVSQASSTVSATTTLTGKVAVGPFEADPSIQLRVSVSSTDATTALSLYNQADTADVTLELRRSDNTGGGSIAYTGTDFVFGSTSSLAINPGTGGNDILFLRGSTPWGAFSRSGLGRLDLYFGASSTSIILGSGTSIDKHVRGTLTVNAESIIGSGSTTTVMTLSGASTGDHCDVDSTAGDLLSTTSTVVLACRITAANEATIYYRNTSSTAAFNAGSSDLSVQAWSY